MTDISKIDMDRINGLIDKLNSMKYVVETWNEGTEWYRIWSDGWIEQGGFISAKTSNTITFIKPFKNTDYLPIFTPYANMGSHIVYVKTKENTNISIYNGDSKEIAISWYACGY
uniref:Tail fiber protein fold, Tail fiber, receptor n=1 Tax=Myoviridae sp. ctWb16 TaxID=2827690 RepID=A0A8S5T002_9CAUD|nr:MAG TPA: Putative tail fiber protein fold, Tail fiber, receptor [Myoviridae sp. ctWb16]